MHGGPNINDRPAICRHSRCVSMAIDRESEPKQI